MSWSIKTFRYRKGEIDLIFKKGNWLIFSEVKLRSNTYFGQPEKFVSKSQLNLIKKTAEAYIFQVNWQGNIRFDIIAIVKNSSKFELMHFEDVY